MSIGGFQVDASGIWKKKEGEDKFRGRKQQKSSKKKYKESGRTGGKKNITKSKTN